MQILIFIKHDYPSISDNSQWPLAVISGLALFSLLTATFVVNSRSFEKMHKVALTDLGRNLFTDWALPFEIASMVLLLALIGSIVIAKVERRR